MGWHRLVGYFLSQSISHCLLGVVGMCDIFQAHRAISLCRIYLTGTLLFYGQVKADIQVCRYLYSYFHCNLYLKRHEVFLMRDMKSNEPSCFCLLAFPSCIYLIPIDKHNFSVDLVWRQVVNCHVQSFYSWLNDIAANQRAYVYHSCGQ